MESNTFERIHTQTCCFYWIQISNHQLSKRVHKGSEVVIRQSHFMMSVSDQTIKKEKCQPIIITTEFVLNSSQWFQKSSLYGFSWLWRIILIQLGRLKEVSSFVMIFSFFHEWIIKELNDFINFTRKLFLIIIIKLMWCCFYIGVWRKKSEVFIITMRLQFNSFCIEKKEREYVFTTSTESESDGMSVCVLETFGKQFETTSHHHQIE